MSARLAHTSGMEPLPLGELLKPRPSFRVRTSKGLIAAALWDHGEDAFAQRALGMSEEERLQIAAISAWYEMPEYRLPLSGQRITHSHVAAFAAVTLYEGAVRPLARTRRRAAKDRPPEFNG